ncbi:MAG: hypothetical protein AAF483_09815, partial [Planctomycetota bacterium]
MSKLLQLTADPCSKLFRLLLVFLLALNSIGTSADGQEADQDSEEAQSHVLEAAKMLPPTVIAFGEVKNLADAIELVLEHPLRNKIEQLAPYQEFLESPQFSQLQGGTLVFEAGMGMRWPSVIRSATAKGVFFAAEPTDESVAAIIHADNGKVLDNLRKTAFPLIRGGKAGTDADPVKTEAMDGYDLYSINDESYLADLEDWYVLGNKPDFVKQIAANHLAKDSTNTLAESERFQQALQFRPESFLLWSYVDANTIRESGEAVALYSGKTENVLIEMLAGGIMSNLLNTDLISMSLHLEENQVQLSLKTPHDYSWAGEDREYFFGKEGDAKAPQLPEVEQRVFALSAYRDLSEMWLRASDLMSDKAVDELALADSQLGVFFSGKDFGEDILGALGPKIQMVVNRQNFENISPRPAI